jgi:predicted nuclease of restriction endonuclease-like (RecB) superfamily
LTISRLNRNSPIDASSSDLRLSDFQTFDSSISVFQLSEFQLLPHIAIPSKPRKPGPKPSEESRISRGRTRPEAIFPVAPTVSALPETYAATLQEIKTHLRNARIRAILAANPVVIESYWHTGKIILARQQEAAWGAKVIDRLAADLQEAFPDMSGLSSRNLLAMKIFAREFPSGPIAQQPVAQLPWGHVLQIMQRAKDPAARDFYIRETLTHGWSRAILEIQIQNQLHLRVGKAQNNFALTMPPAESDMAAQLFKESKRTSSSPSMPCAAWTNPSPSPPGRPNSPNPSPRNCAAVYPPSKKSKPSWLATFLPNPPNKKNLMTDALAIRRVSPAYPPKSSCGVSQQAVLEASRFQSSPSRLTISHLKLQETEIIRIFLLWELAWRNRVVGQHGVC